MALLNKKHFVCTDIEKNSNKFWIGELYDDARVIMRFGRVGSAEQIKEKKCQSQSEAQKFFDSKVKDKSSVRSRRDSYTEIKVLESNSSTVINTSKNIDIEEVALNEIQTKSNSAKDLIRWLCKVNKHNILTNTTIKYDISDGTFKTPLGVIDKTCLNQARILLDSIEPYIKEKNYTDPKLTQLVNSYLRYIPQDLGSSNIKIGIKTVFPDLLSLDKQSSLIDSLNASISSAKLVDNNVDKMFDTCIEEVSQSDIREYKTGNYKISRIFSIKIASVYNNYNNIGSKKGNIIKAWHGTDAGNALSILRGGLIIPTNYTNGRVYGHGIYMDKNLATPIGYANYRDGKRLVFLVEAALGKYKQHGSVTLSDDSLWLNGNGYIVIPRCNQVNLLYLCEFF